MRRLKVCAQIAGKETNQIGAGRGKEREIEIADWELGLTMAAAREVESGSLTRVSEGQGGSIYRQRVG